MTVHPSKSILLFGATGVIGKPITNALIQNESAFDRIVVFTASDSEEPKKSLLAGWKASGVEVVVGDVGNESQVREAYKGIDTVVCALGRSAILPQIPLIEWADTTPNIKRFLPSEYGTDIEHNAQSIHEKTHQGKIKVRAAMAETTTLDYTYVVTGPYSDLYFGKMAIDEIGTFDVKAGRAVLLGTGDEKISFTSMNDVGNLVYTVLTKPGPCSKRALKVQSYVTTPNRILAEFESQTGSKWEVRYIPVDDLKKTEDQMWKEGHPAAAGGTLRRIWSTGGTLYDEWDNEKIGAPQMESLEQGIREAIQKQRAQ